MQIAWNNKMAFPGAFNQMGKITPTGILIVRESPEIGYYNDVLSMRITSKEFFDRPKPISGLILA
jgi:hypothetical protein